MTYLEWMLQLLLWMSSHSRQHTRYILVPHLRNVLHFLWQTIILVSQLQWPSIASEAGLSHVIQKPLLSYWKNAKRQWLHDMEDSSLPRRCPDSCCTFFNVTSIHLGSYQAKFLGNITKRWFYNALQHPADIQSLLLLYHSNHCTLWVHKRAFWLTKYRGALQSWICWWGTVKYCIHLVWHCYYYI